MNCIVCECEFEKVTVWQKFCSSKCREKYWDIKLCKKKQIYQKYRNARRRYGMSKEQYDTMFQAQDGKCKLCGLSPKPPRRGLNIDHCHKTKIIRGFLCNNCNHKVIGAVENIGLDKIADYLGYELKRKEVK